MEELKAISQIVGSLSVTAVVLYGMYLLIGGKLNTAKHTEDVAAGKDELNNQLRDDLKQSLAREDVLRQELLADTQAMNRMESAIRDLTTTIASWRPTARR